eukprot:525421-Rhodomonas_salina.2
MSGTDVALSAHYAMPGTDPYISIAFPLALLVPLAISSTDTAAYEAPNACPVLKCTILLPGARDYVDLWPRRRRRHGGHASRALHLPPGHVCSGPVQYAMCGTETAYGRCRYVVLR